MYLALLILAHCVLLLFVTHERAAGMLKYSAGELYRLRYDVTVYRMIRKTIFSHHLWCPRRTREMFNELLQKSTQCIWSPSIALNWSSTRSSPTPRQQLMTSSQSSPSRVREMFNELLQKSTQCIWSPSIALNTTSTRSSPTPRQQLMTSYQSSPSRNVGKQRSRCGLWNARLERLVNCRTLNWL
jgi:hypothetical protein